MATTVSTYNDLENTLDAAIEMLGADMGNIQIFDHETKTLRVAAFRGFDETSIGHFRGVTEVSGTACGRALSSLQRVVICDVEDDDQYKPFREAARQAGYRGVQSTPLLNRNSEIVGILSTHFREAHRPSDVQLRMLDLYARQAVDSMELGRIATVALRNERRIRFIDELSEATKNLEEPRDILMAMTKRLKKVLRADTSFYADFIESDQKLALNVDWNDLNELADEIPVLDQFSRHKLDLLKNRKKLVITDSSTDFLSHLSSSEISELGIQPKAYLVSPVMAGTELMGVIVVGQNQSRTWSHHEISMIDQVAERSASHISRGKTILQLRESEERYRSFLTTVPDAVWTTDPVGNMRELNESWGRYTGQNYDEYKNVGWSNAIHPDDYPGMKQEWELCLKELRSFTYDYRLRNANGEYRHVRSQGAPVLDSRRQVREWLGICNDIHQQYLIESRNKFLVELDDAVRWESSPQTIIQTSIKMLSLYLNATRGIYAEVQPDDLSYTIFGEYSNDSPYGTGFHNFPDYAVDAMNPFFEGQPIIANDVQNDPLYQSKFEIYHKLEVGAFFLVPLMEFGRLTAFMGIYSKTPRVWLDEEVELVIQVAARSRESLERCRITRELQENEYRLRVAQKAGRTGSFEWYFRSNKMYWSEQLCTLFGISPTDLTDSADDLKSRCLADDIAILIERIHARIKPGDSEITFEFRSIQPNGSLRWLRGQALIQSDFEGLPQKMIGICFDIDDQKRADVALREADRRKDEFLATLAHELRSPLAPIRNAIEILQLGENPEEVIQEYHDVIERQVGQMVRLVDDLLDVSRITRGKIELQQEPIKLVDSLKNAIEISRPVIDSGEHVLIVEAPDEDIWLNADHTRLAQVFSNLLNNAAKYSHLRTEITLSVQKHQNEVEVRVTDHGIGIPQHMLEKIFETFVQVDTSIHRSQGGLGIGLTLVKRLVELHGGSIHVEMNPVECGTTFAVRLPTIEPGSSNLGASLIDAQKQKSQYEIRRCKILVVDDTPAARYMVSRLLEKLKQEVFTADSATAGLELAEKIQPQMIISDIGMPGIDGYHFAEMVRASPKLAGVRMVALTGYGQDTDRIKAVSAGFDFHLVKPVSISILYQLLSKESI